MTVRAKMVVTELTRHRYGGGTIKFGAEYDTSIPEDQRFQKATPSGHIEMTIDNPAALEQLAPGGMPGGAFYVDFTPVPPAE